VRLRKRQTGNTPVAWYGINCRAACDRREQRGCSDLMQTIAAVERPVKYLATQATAQQRGKKQ
jgi:hypothetical protein